MALDFAWMLLVCLAITLALTLGVWLILKAKDERKKKVFYFANTSRLTKLPEYIKAMKIYRLGLIATLILFALAGGATAVVAAKPVSVEATNPSKYNRDIVLCLDVSGSMLSVDAQIIEKFKTLTKSFQGERISLVIFNSIGNEVFPLTDDYVYMQEQFKKILLGLQGDYTNGGYNIMAYTVRGAGSSLIGDGLTGCLSSFDNTDPTDGRSRSIILATDNVTNGEELISLADAATLAKERSITVYGINPEGLGLVSPEEIEFAPTEQEIQAHKEAVELTGGEYYGLSDEQAVPSIIDRISSEETTSIANETVISKTDKPEMWIILASILTLLSLALAWRFKL